MGAANRASMAGAAAAGAVPQLDNGARSYLPRVPDNNSGLGAAPTPAASRTAPAATTVASSAATAASSTQHRAPHNDSEGGLGAAVEPAATPPQWTRQRRRRPPPWRERVTCGFG